MKLAVLFIPAAVVGGIGMFMVDGWAGWAVYTLLFFVSYIPLIRWPVLASVLIFLAKVIWWKALVATTVVALAHAWLSVFCLAVFNQANRENRL
jgi:hypothetical protein